MPGFSARIGMTLALNLVLVSSFLILVPASVTGQVVEIRREILDSQRRLEQVRQERTRLQQECLPCGRWGA